MQKNCGDSPSARLNVIIHQIADMINVSCNIKLGQIITRKPLWLKFAFISIRKSCNPLLKQCKSITPWMLGAKFNLWIFCGYGERHDIFNVKMTLPFEKVIVFHLSNSLKDTLYYHQSFSERKLFQISNEYFYFSFISIFKTIWFIN